jgi:iron complex outermembrane recepter protein
MNSIDTISNTYQKPYNYLTLLTHMKRLLYLLALWTTFIPAFGQTESGAIRGIVKTSDGTPAEFVHVGLKETTEGTITNSKGAFEIKKVAAGSYTLVVSFVGLETLETQVVVNASETTNVPEITLKEDATQLQEVVVSAFGKGNKFADKETDFVARMPLKNLENPQVYSVVNKELIEEQVITDINETVRNAPGVVPVDYPSGGFGSTFRGFSIGVSARNGMETATGRSSIDIANLERIEVLKGPSGTLFGGNVSSFGGLINVVTKRPFETKKYEVTYTTGSYNLQRLTADINAPLNEEKTVLFRLNAAVNKEKSFLNYGFNNFFMVSPSILYKASDKLTFTIDAELFNVNNTRTRYSRYGANSGITSPEQIKLDYKTELYHDDADAETSSSKIFAQAHYQLSENWTSTTLFSFVGEDVDHSYQYYPTWISPTVVARRAALYGPIYNNFTNFQQNVNGEFSTGRVNHKMLVGASYRYYNSNGGSGFSAFIDTVDVTTNFAALRKSEIDADPNIINKTTWASADQHTVSGYVTDVVEFTDKLSAMLSLRIDHFKLETVADAEGYEQTALAPKLGLVYQLVKDRVSIFGNYMSGFQNQQPATQPDGSQFVLDPVYAVQSEGGVKAEAFDKKLSATVSYYNIKIDNAIRTDADGFTRQDGEQVSKGFDLEIISNPIAGLNIVAGYAYNDNRILKASDESIEGNKAVNSPESVINFWVSYTFQNKLRGVGVGFGGNYVGQNYMFADNVFTIPAYTVLNATVFYNQPKWRVGAKLNNLTNEKYWTIWGVPQAPTNIAASLALKF